MTPRPPAIARRCAATAGVVIGATALSLLTVAPASAAPAPVKAVGQQPRATGPGGTYTVVAGDTVSGIAKAHGTTTAAIISANGLDSRALIRVGQVLTIPGADTSTAPGTAAPAAPPRGDGRYTVVAGDVVSAIAKRFGTTTAAIVAANGLNASATIRIGQVLTIPGSGGTSAPTTPTAPTAPQPSNPGSHKVAAGDTVSAIAKKYGTTTAAVVAANGLNSAAMIRVGQTLTIPGAGGTTAPTTPTAPTAPQPSNPGSHKVAAGDTVSAIAKKYGTTTAAVVAANGLNSAAMIRVGQTLTIPGAGGTTAPTTPTAPTAPQPSNPGSHKVAAGDTVSAIAKKYGTTTAAVVAANGLNSAAMIRVGQTLTIPGAGGGAGAPSTGGGQEQLVPNTFLHYVYPDNVVAAANANKRALLDMAVPGRADMQAMIRSTAIEMGVDPALAQALAFQESGFDMRAVSPANAIGVMQVIPSSGDWAGGMVGRKLNLLNPKDNVTAGVAILRHLIRTSPDLPTAIASYYQGAGSVKKNGMYADTKRYVANIQTLMTRYS